MDLIISILVVSTICMLKCNATVKQDTVVVEKVVVAESTTSSESVTQAPTKVEVTMRKSDIPIGDNLAMRVEPEAFMLIPKQLGLVR